MNNKDNKDLGVSLSAGATTNCSPSAKSPTSSASPSPPCATGATSAPVPAASASAAACATGTTKSPPGCKAKATAPPPHESSTSQREPGGPAEEGGGGGPRRRGGGGRGEDPGRGGERAPGVRGDYVDPKTARTLLRTYAAKWEKVQVGRDSTLSVTDNAVRLHINPALGDRRIGSIRQSDIQGLVKTLEGKNLAAGTVRNIYDTAARIFASAVDDRVIPSSPCRRIKLPKDDKGEVVPLTLAQVRALEVGMGDLGAAVITLAGSGLRIGELLGLDVSDVDFLRRTIRVARQRAQSGELTPPKSKSSERTVPVGQTVVDALAAYLKAGDRKSGPLFVNVTWVGRSPIGSGSRSGRRQRRRPRLRRLLTRCAISTPAR